MSEQRRQIEDMHAADASIDYPQKDDMLNYGKSNNSSAQDIGKHGNDITPNLENIRSAGL